MTLLRRLVLPCLILGGCAGPTAPAGGDAATGRVSAKPGAAGRAASGASLADRGATLISDKGGAVVSNNGGALIGNNGAGLVGKVKAPAALVSNNGAGAIAPYRLSQALTQDPLAGARVTLVDVGGRAIAGADGRPLEARTDAQGAFRFPGIAVLGSVVVAVALPGERGTLRAIAHRGAAGRPVDVDVASTLAVTHLLDAVVKGRQDVLERIDAAAAERLRAAAEAALVATPGALPSVLGDAAAAQVVADLRARSAGLDAELARVEADLAAPAAPAPSVLEASPPAPAASPSAAVGSLVVLAGSTRGYADGSAWEAQFAIPYGIVAGGAGTFYVADSGNNRIRVIGDAGVTTLAGSGEYAFADGQGAAAGFRLPKAIAADKAGNLYVADSGPDSESQRIRKVTPGGLVSTLAGTGVQGDADGPGSSATFFNVHGLAVDAAGNAYAVEATNRIRKITPAGVVSTLAGAAGQGAVDGPVATARFASPYGIAVDAAGNLYVADTGNFRVRKITPAGVVSTLAGGARGLVDGAGAEARFDEIRGIAVDGAGDVFVADSFNRCIRKVTPAGVVSTFAKVGVKPYGLTIDAAGYLVFTDQTVHRVYKWTVPVAPAR